jgi:hypothetical protein
MRKLAAGGLLLFLINFGISSGSFGQTAPPPRGEIRVVDKSPANWVFVTMHVFISWR